MKKPHRKTRTTQPSAIPPSTRLVAATATALLRDDSGHYELQIAVSSGNGFLTATLVTPNLDATGHGQATLVRASRYSTILAATVALNGYDLNVDRFSDFEVSIGATWTLSRCDPTTVELAGTALITDLSTQVLTNLRAVRHHPYNHIDQVDAPTEPALPSSDNSPLHLSTEQNQHRLLTA